MSPNGNPVFFPARFFQTCIFLLFALIFCQPAFAGVLDPTFGTGGRVTLDLSSNGNSSYGNEVFVQLGGRIITRNTIMCPSISSFLYPGYAYVGLTSNGAIDPIYGTNGQFRVCAESVRFQIVRTKMIPDGRFFVLGYSESSTSQNMIPFLRLMARDGGIERGYSIMLGNSTLPWGFSIQDDGKLMVLLSAPGLSRVLMRLNLDGTRDQTFGNGGLMELGRLPTIPLTDMISTPDGKTIMAFSDGTVARLDRNGYFDRIFGNQGVAKLYYDPTRQPYIAEALLQPDGKVLLVGRFPYPFGTTDVFMARFTARGRMDGNFGGAGVVLADFSPGQDDQASDAVLLSDGKIVIVGRAWYPLIPQNNFLLARYSSTGVLEATTKAVFTELPASNAIGVDIQPDGKVVAAGMLGQNQYFSVFGNRVGIARFNEISDSEKTY